MKLYSNITILFIIWLCSLIFIFFFGFLTLPQSEKFSNDFLKSFSNWDGGHYLGIAQFGYTEKFQYAFFPFFPLIINIVNKLTSNYLIAALLINVVSAFLAVQVFFNLLKLDLEKKLAEKAALYLLIFPTSFFLLTIYSESIFLLFSLSSFFFLRKNKLLFATIFAAFASATRLAGIALVIALIIDVWTKEGINRKNWYVLLSPLGLIFYCWYLYNQTLDPFYFLVAENHWQRILVAPGLNFWQTLTSLSSNGFILSHFNIFLDLLFAILGVGLSIRAFRFLPLNFAMYSLLSVSVPLLTPALSSIPRFLLPIFPIFILIAQVKNQYLILAYQIISLMLLSIFAILFINGYWVS